MPTYEYRCAKCGNDLEVFQSFSEAPLKKHEACGGKLARVLSPAGIVLKGSGFYKTDNRSGSSKGAKSGSEAGNNGDSGSSSGKSDSSKSDSSKSDSSKSDSSKSDSKSTSGSDTKSKSSDAKSA